MHTHFINNHLVLELRPASQRLSIEKKNKWGSNQGFNKDAFAACKMGSGGSERISV